MATKTVVSSFITFTWNINIIKLITTCTVHASLAALVRHVFDVICVIEAFHRHVATHLKRYAIWHLLTDPTLSFFYRILIMIQTSTISLEFESMHSPNTFFSPRSSPEESLKTAPRTAKTELPLEWPSELALIQPWRWGAFIK